MTENVMKKQNQQYMDYCVCVCVVKPDIAFLQTSVSSF